MYKNNLRNILDLANKVEFHQATRDHGATEPITYTFRKDNTTSKIGIRAFVNYGEDREDSSEHRSDKKDFCMIQLEREPNRRDEIKFNGDVYLVDTWKKVNSYSYLYDVTTISHNATKHYRGSR